MNAKFEFTVGRLLRGTVRRFLERERFNGAAVEWLEEKGLLVSRFNIKGEQKAVSNIQKAIASWSADMSNEDRT